MKNLIQQWSPMEWLALLVRHAVWLPIKHLFYPPVPIEAEPTALQHIEADLTHSRFMRLKAIAKVEDVDLANKVSSATARAAVEMWDERIVRLGKDLKTEAQAAARTKQTVGQANADNVSSISDAA